MPTKEILEELYYTKKYPLYRIAKDLQISRNKVSQLFKEYSLIVRDPATTAYLQHGKTFNILDTRDAEQEKLYGIGIGLYWGEGNKTDPNSVRLGNTDPSLLLTFIRFLRVICGIAEDDIKFGLQVFNDTDSEAAIQYWIKTLGCNRNSFHKTIVSVPQQGRGLYKKKSEYGVLQIYVCNKRFKIWFMKELDKCAEVAQW